MTRMRKSGGYRDLKTFQCATIIYDATYWFCERSWMTGRALLTK